MPNLELDEATVQALKEAALSRNMTIDEFIRLRLLGNRSECLSASTSSFVNFDVKLDELIFYVPSLPADFSSADIYADHD